MWKMQRNEKTINNKVTIHILTKDRHSELALLLQSLRTQTYQDFDIIIVDDASGSPITNCHFLVSLINRIKLENHKIKIIRNDMSFGCCYGRNKCIDEDDFGNTYTLRLDDDVILPTVYIQQLMNVIEKGYDMATGVVPLLAYPELKRRISFVGDIINKHEFDNEGNLVKQNDECGYCYLDSVILPTHQFRTNCLYKSEIHNKVRYPDNLTTVAFREEGFFSFKAIIEGYKIGVNTSAVCYHLQTPSGGNRRQDYADCVKIDDETFKKWCKNMFIKYGDFLNKYNQEVLNNG